MRDIVSRYLGELIEYGGFLRTRGEVIAEMQAEGHPQGCIDRWLQGQEHAAERRRRQEQVSLQMYLKPVKRTRRLTR